MSAQAVLFDAPGPKARLRHNILAVVGVIGIAVILYFVVVKMGQAQQLQPSLWTPFLTPQAWLSYLIPGVIGTFGASVVSVFLAGIFGLVFGMGRLSHNRVIRMISGAVVEVFRSIPVLLMMIFAFTYFSRNGVFRTDLNPFMAVVTALTLYNGSVIAELVRSGVYALPKGQSEAGLSIGLTPGQTLRQIQLPQALVAMLPALLGQLVVVIKDSALGYQITYLDLLNWSKTLGSAYGNVVPAYLVAAALFIGLNWAMTKLAGWVEARLKRTHHVAGPITTTVPNIVQGSAEPGPAVVTDVTDVESGRL
ncbi:MAG: amino acid ABC transporter permease [Micropruina sp.]